MSHFKCLLYIEPCNERVNYGEKINKTRLAEISYFALQRRAYPNAKFHAPKVITLTVVGIFPHPAKQARLSSLRQSRHFQRLRIVTYSLPFAKNTSQRLTWLRRSTSTCSFTTISSTNYFPPCLGKTTCMIYFPTNFDCILPYPVFLVFIPFTVKFLFTYRTGLICQGTCWCWDRGVRLGS